MTQCVEETFCTNLLINYSICNNFKHHTALFSATFLTNLLFFSCSWTSHRTEATKRRSCSSTFLDQFDKSFRRWKKYITFSWLVAASCWPILFIFVVIETERLNQLNTLSYMLEFNSFGTTCADFSGGATWPVGLQTSVEHILVLNNTHKAMYYYEIYSNVIIFNWRVTKPVIHKARDLSYRWFAVQEHVTKQFKI